MSKPDIAAVTVLLGQRVRALEVAVESLEGIRQDDLNMLTDWLEECVGTIDDALATLAGKQPTAVLIDEPILYPDFGLNIPKRFLN